MKLQKHLLKSLKHFNTVYSPYHQLTLRGETTYLYSTTESIINDRN